MYSLGILILLIPFILNNKVLAKEQTPNLDPEKITFCHITINSDDEKKMFEKKIREQSGDKKVQFVELTEMGEAGNWFKQACESQIKCDVLNISGHFGGNFFGSSKLELTSNQMENAMCSEDCKGILEHPVEVYLWGSNTLAGKKSDNRSPEEYMRLLIDDHGHSRAEAEKVAALRYSPVGTSFRDQMQGIFKNVAHIYGFKSRAPLGKQVDGMIANYLDMKGDYANYLAGERSKQLAQYLKKASEQVSNPSYEIKGNQELYESLSRTHFTQIRNQTAKCGDRIFTSDADNFANLNCVLRNRKLSLLEKLEAARDTLQGDSAFAFAPAITSLFAMIGMNDLSEEERAVFEEIKNNNRFKNELLSLVDQLSGFPRSAFELIDLSKGAEWITPDRALELKGRYIKRILKGVVSLEDKNLICSIDGVSRLGGEIDFEEIKASNYKNKFALEAIGCLRPTDEKTLLALTEGIKDANSDVRNAAALALGDIKPTNEKIHLVLAEVFQGENSYARGLAAVVLGEIRPKNENIHLVLAAALRGQSLDIRQTVAWALGEIKSTNEKVHLALAEALRDNNELVRENAAWALGQSRPINQKVREALMVAQRDENPRVKKAAIEALKE